MRKIMWCLVMLVSCVAVAAATFQILSALSPRNAHRPALQGPRYIILHTTEGAAAGSLAKLRKNGEAHFLVTRQGEIYRIIENGRLAKHAGRSMWNGRTNIDEVSLGIETEGYHDKPMTAIQEKALAYLLAQLKARFQIPDENILTHSMVAYGAPNRWFAQAQRGRKRCGMLMADPAVRRRLGIGPGPSRDPDVDQHRLIVGDRPLFAALFDSRHRAGEIAAAAYAAADSNVISENRSAWFIARERYDDPTTIYTLPDGRVLRGHQVRNWKELPEGTKVTYDHKSASDIAVDAMVAALARAHQDADADDDSAELKMKRIGKDGDTAYEVAGNDYAKATTIYFFPEGRVRTGEQLRQQDPALLRNLPVNTGVLVGYVYGGYVSAERSALAIAGAKWNSPSTFYRIPADAGRARVSLVSGDDIDDGQIPPGTLIFYAL